MAYLANIGLEIHAQLRTHTKAFCACPNRSGAPPNTALCPTCTGQPGALPVLNAQAVRLAVTAGLALGCTIHPRSTFARKHYFYPDLPKGYQITQFRYPLCTGGCVTFEDKDGAHKQVPLQRIHLEEDAGQLLHDHTPGVSAIDFNRSGIPLIEIVTEPTLQDADDTVAFLKHLRETLLYLEICDGKMQEGSFRCDVNISLRPDAQAPFGTRTELKNMNSFRFIHDAICYEIQRQSDLLARGQTLPQQTRTWDPHTQRSLPLRSKEQAPDYRYFPEPDLPPLQLPPNLLQSITLPELPLAKRQRFAQAYKLPPEDIATLCAQRELADYFEACAAQAPSPKSASNWIRRDLLHALQASSSPFPPPNLPPTHLAQLLWMLHDSKLSTPQAQTLQSLLLEEGGEPEEVRLAHNLRLLDDDESLRQTIAHILAEHPQTAARLREGEQKLLGFFMGLARKHTQGRANMKRLKELLQEAITRRGL